VIELLAEEIDSMKALPPEPKKGRIGFSTGRNKVTQPRFMAKLVKVATGPTEPGTLVQPTREPQSGS
jgi:hypothetical protein